MNPFFLYVWIKSDSPPQVHILQTFLDLPTHEQDEFLFILSGGDVKGVTIHFENAININNPSLGHVIWELSYENEHDRQRVIDFVKTVRPVIKGNQHVFVAPSMREMIEQVV